MKKIFKPTWVKIALTFLFSALIIIPNLITYGLALSCLMGSCRDSGNFIVVIGQIASYPYRLVIFLVNIQQMILTAIFRVSIMYNDTLTLIMGLVILYFFICLLVYIASLFSLLSMNNFSDRVKNLKNISAKVIVVIGLVLFIFISYSIGIPFIIIDKSSPVYGFEAIKKLLNINETNNDKARALFINEKIGRLDPTPEDNPFNDNVDIPKVNELSYQSNSMGKLAKINVYITDHGTTKNAMKYFDQHVCALGKLKYTKIGPNNVYYEDDEWRWDPKNLISSLPRTTESFSYRWISQGKYITINVLDGVWGALTVEEREQFVITYLNRYPSDIDKDVRYGKCY